MGIIDYRCSAEFYAIIIEVIMTINRFSEPIVVAMRFILSVDHLKSFQYRAFYVICQLVS